MIDYLYHHHLSLSHRKVSGVQPVKVGRVLELVVLLPRGDGHRGYPDQTHHHQFGQVEPHEPPVCLQI